MQQATGFWHELAVFGLCLVFLWVLWGVANKE